MITLSGDPDLVRSNSNLCPSPSPPPRTGRSRGRGVAEEERGVVGVVGNREEVEEVEGGNTGLR